MYKLKTLYLKLIFFLSSDKKKNKLIKNSAFEFFRLQRLGNIAINNYGDDMSSYYYSDKSIIFLNKFIIYCYILGISVYEELDKYKKEWTSKNI